MKPGNFAATKIRRLIRMHSSLACELITHSWMMLVYKIVVNPSHIKILRHQCVTGIRKKNDNSKQLSYADASIWQFFLIDKFFLFSVK